MALYRKYRPQTLSELDSQTLGKRLATLFTTSDIPHAYLFAGPKGTGKTSTARIVAKILDCTNNKDPKDLTKLTSSEPCNVCDACKAITDGRQMDVLEIDAASNRGIDEIRELRENIKLSPVSSLYKVYIIDEAHMLTNEAFNALLKTLEEPPSHAIFILATTEANKLPETIVSRCMVFQFQKATNDEILHALKRVTTGEKIVIEEEALRLIAEYADGSFRDATKMLEQSIAEKALTADTVSEIFGATSNQISHFLDILKEKKTKEALEVILSLEHTGGDVKIFVAAVLKQLHRSLLSQYGIESTSAKTAFSSKEATTLIKLFSRVYTELRGASIATLPVEVAIVEWCEAK